MSQKIYICDSLGLACGAFFTLTAHPPGYIGYTTLGRLVNYFLDDINRSFVIINIISTAVATSLLFFLGVDMFGFATGLIVALFYTTSLASLYFSEVAVSFSVEGFFAIAVAFFAWHSLNKRSLNYALWSTFLLGLGGSVRQTTLVFLFPLWAYTILASLSHWQKRLVAFLFLIVIVTAWMIPNSYYLQKYWGKGKQNFIDSFYNFQIVSGQSYDVPNVLDHNYGGLHRRFVWPSLQLIGAIYKKFKNPAKLNSEEVENASILYSLRLIAYQVMKLGFYTALTIGLSCPFLVSLLFYKRIGYLFNKRVITFLTFWIFPAALFFALGHFGSWGYLLIFLGALCLLAGYSVMIFVGHLPLARTANRNLLAGIVCVVIISNLSFFIFIKPLPETSSRNKLLNIALFQYAAPAIQQSFARARSTSFTEDPRQIPIDCVTDECLRKDLPKYFHLDPDMKPSASFFRKHK